MTDLGAMPISTLLIADIGLTILQLLLFFVSFWLIFVILIQRGKGGGLTAAFGGGGGDSAFGAKAGDAFTWITIWSSLIWITLCMVTIAYYNPPDAPQNPFAQVDEQTMEGQKPAMGGASMSPGEPDSGEAGSASTESEGSSETESGAAAGSAETENATATEGEGAINAEGESSDP